MQQFKLEGSDASHVADVLAAGAGKAQGDVSDLSQALSQSGLVANQFGLSVDETVGTLSAFASAGMLGSDAGTSFRTMLLRLANPTGEAAAEMQKLGINAYDASGQFVGMTGLAGQLQTGLQGLTQEQQNAALAIIFGQDAIRGANVLFAEGSKGIADWTAQVNDQGYAAETARRMLDNLKGDVEQLGGAMDTALIQTGSTANDTLRAMAQALTGLVDLYNDLPGPVQAAVLAVGGATAAVLLSGGTALSAIPKWQSFKATVAEAGLSMKGIGLSAGGAGLALGGLFMIVGELAAKQQRAAQLAQQYADTIAAGADKVSDAARKITVDELKKGGEWYTFNWQSAYDAADKLGISLDTVTDAAMGNQDAMAKLKPYYDALGGDTAKFYDLASKSGMSAAETRLALESLTNGIGSQNEAIKRGVDLKGQEARANEEVASSTKTAAEGYLDEADKVEQLNSQLRQLVDKINESNGANQSAISSNAQYQQALAGISQEVQQQKDAFEQANGSLDGFSLSLDQNTVSGSANAAMLADVAGAAQDAANKQYQVDLATMSGKDAADKYAATLADQKQKFIDSATAAGFSADQVQILADKVFALPLAKSMDLLANTGPAVGAIDDFINRYGYLNGTIEYRAILPDLNGAASGNGRMGTYAAGGRILGRGTSTSDEIPLWASNGEHMLTAQEVTAAGGHDAVDQWRAMLRAGQQATPRALPPTLGLQTSSPASQGPLTYAQSPQVHVTVTAPVAATPGPTVVVEDHSTNYSYDPDEKVKALEDKLRRGMNAYQIR